MDENLLILLISLNADLAMKKNELDGIAKQRMSK